MDVHPLRFLKNLGRSREIATVFLNQGFGDLIDRLGLSRYLNWGRRMLRREPPPGMTTARRIRLALQELGPTFIKLGQVMSTRPDLIPQELIKELSLLQEQVPPFPGEQAIAAIELELHAPVSRLFAEFDPQPLAAGSLGQVHRARHHDGTPLAVKVRRPNVVREVERDLLLLGELAVLIERHIPEAEVFDPTGLVQHFTRTIRREMNFRREARTLDEFSRLFKHDATLKVPRVYDDLTTDALITMEFIEGVRADDRPAVVAAGLSPELIAANGSKIFMKMAFDLGIFHGDPHPGNMRIQHDGTIALLDFGMVGFLDEAKREQLIDLLVSVARKDVATAVKVVQSIGQPSRVVDQVLLRADVHDFVETYYGVALAQVKIGHMLTDFVHILANHGLRCPGDLMLLIRALVTLEGVGRSLDPTYNLAGELAPFVETLVRRRYDPRRLAEKAFEEVKTLVHAAHEIPISLGQALTKLSRDDLKIQLEHRGVDHLITEFDRSSNRIVVALVVSSLIVSSALVIRTGNQPSWITIPVFTLSGLLGVWLIYGILRSGRL